MLARPALCLMDPCEERHLELSEYWLCRDRRAAVSSGVGVKFAGEDVVEMIVYDVTEFMGRIL